MTTKKQLVQVKGLPGSTRPPYSLGSINFAYVSSPATGRSQVTELITCREYVMKKVWHAVNEYQQNMEVPPLDLSKLRLLIVHDPQDSEGFRRRLFSGKSALNLLEKFNNWSPSTITTVRHQYYKNAWLLTSPAEWMSQPQLLSLATWILRLISKDGPINTDNYDVFESELFQIKEKAFIGNGAGGIERTPDNGSYLKAFWDKLYIIMKYHNEIFKDVGLLDAWPSVEKHDYIHVNGGLLTFVNEDANYTEYARASQKRFFELCNKHLPRKN